MERFGFLSKSFCIFVLSYFKTVKFMYKEELKKILLICDEVNEFLEKISLRLSKIICDSGGAKIKLLLNYPFSARA